MADKTLTDFLYAYSLGCLEDENKKTLIEYLNSNEDYPWQELGEYQNLAALLPVILELEDPDPSLKDKVARKLYQVQDELKNKHTEETTEEKIDDEIEEVEEIPESDDFAEIQFKEGPIEPPAPPEEKNVEEEIEEKPAETQENEIPEEREKINLEINKTIPQPPFPPPPPPAGNKGPIIRKSKRDEIFEITEPEKFRLEEEKKPEETSPVQKPKETDSIRESKDKTKDEETAKNKEQFNLPRPPVPPIKQKEEPEKNKIEEKKESFKMPENFSLSEEKKIEKIDDEFEGISDIKIEEESLMPPKTEKPKPSTAGSNKDYSPVNPPPEKSKKWPLIALLIIIVLLIAGGYYFYQRYSSEISGYQSHIEYLNKQISDLKQQIAENKGVTEQFNSGKSKIVDLKLTPHHSQGSGKLILDLENNSGYMQLTDMPTINSHQAYQLWLITEGKVISLGVFKPANDNSTLYPFTLPHIADTHNLNFVLTIEPSSGSESPSRSVILTGSVQ